MSSGKPPLRVTNLGWKTDIAVIGSGAETTDSDGDLVIRTVDRKDFYWGNFLLLAEAPAEADIDKCIERFLSLFPKEVYGHIAIGWHAPNLQASEPFLRRGFQLDHCHVSVSSSVPKPSRKLEQLEVVEAQTDEDWNAICQLSLADRDPIHSHEGYESFVRQQILTRRTLVREGSMTWFVGKLQGKVVGSMGLHIADGAGRFQDVVTHKDYRGRGVCGTLLTEVCRRGLEELGAQTLVLLASVDGPGWRIYQAHGFVASDSVCGVWLPPQ